MKINTKTRYGLRTMIEIALQSQHVGILQKEIARKQNISEKYLDHIIAALKVSGLIINVNGKKSGYKLVRSAKKINIYDIYRAFNPDIAMVTCVSGNENCNNEKQCTVKSYWQELNELIISSMSAQSLQDLVDKHIKMSKQRKKHIMYYI